MRTAASPCAWIDWSTVVSGGMVERRLGDVVEADDRHVVGHPDAELGGGAHRLDRRQVVGGEDRGRSRPAGQQLARRRLGGLLLEAADQDEIGIEGDAGRVERGAVAGFASPRRLEVGAAGEERDPAVAERR